MRGKFRLLHPIKESSAVSTPAILLGSFAFDRSSALNGAHLFKCRTAAKCIHHVARRRKGDRSDKKPRDPDPSSQYALFPLFPADKTASKPDKKIHIWGYNIIPLRFHFYCSCIDRKSAPEKGSRFSLRRA